MKESVDMAVLAAQRLACRLERIASVRQAMRDALVRLDWREARRRSDLLHAMGAGSARPVGESEREALVAKLTRLIAEERARSEALP